MYGSKKLFSGRVFVSILLTLFISLSVFPVYTSQVSAANGNKEIQLKRVAQEFLIVAKAQYNKEMYDAAMISLQKANQYRQYLNSSQKQELDELMAKVKARSSAFQEFESTMNLVDSYIADERLKSAMSVLEDLQNQKSLTPDMKSEVQAKSRQVEALIAEQRERLQNVYQQSVSLFEQGELEQAREGFEQIAITGIRIGAPGQTAEAYIDRIDVMLDEIEAQEDQETLQQQQSDVVEVEDPLLAIETDDNGNFAQEPQQVPAQPNQPPVTQPQDAPQAPAQTQDQAQTDPITGSYIDVVTRQRSIQQSYTKAVVDDALAAAENFRQQNEFEKAQDKLLQAQTLVNRNRLALGDELYRDYVARLEMMQNQIAQEMETMQTRTREEKIEEGRVIAERFRLQQEAERQKRIAELLENARNFQKQQRYEEALQQIELLLAIDPQNDIALTSELLLQDTINFRKQLALKQEIHEEEVGTFHNLMEASIPYDNDIVYPRNWLEISAKRDSDVKAGINKEDMQVYDQLSKVVDLSALTSETPLSEAFNIIRNAVSPPLNIVVKWNDLAENAFIEKSTPINMEGLPAVSLGKGLELLLQSVSGGLAELAYNVEEGVIVIGTRSQLRVQMVTQVYDITDLLLPRVNVSYDLGNISELGQSEEARGGGGGGQTGMTDFDQEDTDVNREENVQEIITTIMQTISPESWYENGGQGTIQVFQNTQLIVLQTPQIQQQVAQLISDLNKRFGMQVAIEARFLAVSEDFLENINFDMDLIYDFGGDLGNVNFIQNNLDGAPNPSLSAFGSYGGIMDDLQVSFLLSATQSNTNQRTLDAPKLTVMNGESATIVITQQQAYVGDYDFEAITSTGDNENVITIADPTIYTISDGVVLNITPTISSDRKYVLLNIGTALSNLDLGTTYDIPSQETGTLFPVTLPLLDSTTIQTRVNVPDQGTLLIGGLKINQQIEREKGVPVLSKIPYLGRLFRNANQESRQNVLLILVKPTVIIKDEAEQDAMQTLTR